MSVKAKLLIDDKEINVLRFSFGFDQGSDISGRPSQKPRFVGLQLVIETRKDLNLADWSFAPNQTKQIELHIYPVILGGKTRKVFFYDSHLVNWNNNFSSTGNQPMSETLHITSAGVEDSNSEGVYSAYWRETFKDNNVEATVLEEPTPNITNLNWIHPETKETLKETTYTENVALTAQIENQESNSATITITKEDGTEFKNGQTELSFQEAINEDGIVELTTLEIKEQWQDFKTADIDKLIAKIDHNGYQKKSSALKIVPPPKVLVSFRPNDNWKGEFGFDWIRKDDTSLFMDNKFDDIISKQYTDSTHTTLETNPNKSTGSFKKDATLLKNLKEKYIPFEVTWKKITDASGNQVNDKHYTEWLSLKKGKEAKVKIHIDVTEKADFLQFDDNTNFTFTPNKIDIKNKTGTKKLSDIITIKCDAEFTTDQEIIIKAYKEGQEEGKLAGKINVWTNDTTKHKQKKVVFVQIYSKLSASAPINDADASLEKDRINKYLEQAYIKLHPDSEIVDLDLTSDTDFSRFVKNGKIQKISTLIPAQTATATKPAKPAIPREKLVDYLEKKLFAIDIKYGSYFKAFYFAENGMPSSGVGNLSGYSASGANYVVVFKSANDQTAAHEFLHSFNLAHTFTNSVASANAEFTYQAKKTDNLLDYSHNITSNPNNNNRCSLYYWQWIKANNSI